MTKQLLFSVSKANGDFIVQPFKGSGKGGQKRNKTMSACRIIHPKSGIAAECQEERSFTQNKKLAFNRLVINSKFQSWLKLETARHNGQMLKAEKETDESMISDNIKVEVKQNGKWVEVDEILQDLK